MNIAELIMTESHSRGLKHFFGLPGGGSPLDMIEAGRQQQVQFVSVAHESTAAIIAGAYGWAKGTAGLAMAVKGVGAGNLAGGAANAYFERLPVVCLCECSPGSVTQRELAQHCRHEGLFESVTKYRARLAPASAPQSVQEAFFQACDGRPGPVLLDLPSDFGRADCAGPLGAKARRSDSLSPEDPALGRARRFIEQHPRIAVIAGADCLREGALEQLREFVEHIGAAVLVGMDARGVFPETHPRWAGTLMGFYWPNVIESEIFNQVDAVVLVGADAMMSHAPWKVSLPTCELSARPEYDTLSPNPAVRVSGDLKTALRGLSAIRRDGIAESRIQETRKQILRHFKRPAAARLAAQDVLEITRRVLPQEGLLVSETGVFVCMLEHLWPSDRPGTYLGTSGGRSMGLTVPALLGAKLARPDVPAIGIGADGSLLMRLGELELFSRMRVAAPIVIINDQALGTMKSRQKSRGLPDYALDLHPVDYPAIARACGIRGVMVQSPEEFERELRLAMNAPQSTLIDARVDPKAYQDSFGPTIGVLS
jgi:acetolactate synthase I/II/III large subunit